MKTSDWLSIVAILLSPIIALQVQRYIDFFRERKSRKMRIFEAIMTTRGERLSQYHVQSLNMIDIDFYGMKVLGFNWRTQKGKNVLNAWKAYLDHLNTTEKLEGNILENWVLKKDELFTDLLFEMSRAIGYDFDKVQLKRSIYTPRAHGDQILDIESIRQNLVQILEGKKPLPMRIVVDDETHQEQKSIQNKFEEILSGQSTIKVELINNSSTEIN